PHNSAFAPAPPGVYRNGGCGEAPYSGWRGRGAFDGANSRREFDHGAGRDQPSEEPGTAYTVDLPAEAAPPHGPFRRQARSRGTPRVLGTPGPSWNHETAHIFQWKIRETRRLFFIRQTWLSVQRARSRW